MSKLTENDQIYPDEVPMIDVGDSVMGGPTGKINIVLSSITNRTAWLKAQLASANTSIASLLRDKADKTALKTTDDKIGQSNMAINSLTGRVKTVEDNKAEKTDVNAAFDALPISQAYAATRQYHSGDLVKVDGIWYECYHPDGCKGKDPRDTKNRPSGWAVSDVSQPYFWIEIGKFLSFPEIGSPIYLPSLNLREGIIKYRNDNALHKDKFWRLAWLYPDLVSNNYIQIADLRAMTLRGLDDGRGIDLDRVLNSYQLDATQKIIGSFGWQGNKLFTVVNGVFRGNQSSIDAAPNIITGGIGEWYSNATFDNSIVARTSSEERVKNIAMLTGCRI